MHPRLIDFLELAVNGWLMDGVALTGRLLARERERDVAYGPHRDHTLDIYRPQRPSGATILYVHGGGFRILSKDTHWIFGKRFAAAGYTVYNINYRLSPTAPFPAAVEDVMDAYVWVARHCPDPTRLVVAGESAGGNLALNLAVAACFRRDEPAARRVFDTGVVPRACIPMCGHLQASDPLRPRKGRVPTGLVANRMAFLHGLYMGEQPGSDLADPLHVIESDRQPERPLPPFLLSAGTRDPILDDTERLEAALARRGVPHRAYYYPGELHAFQAMIFRKACRDYWERQSEFLAEVLSDRAPGLAA